MGRVRKVLYNRAKEHRQRPLLWHVVICEKMLEQPRAAKSSASKNGIVAISAVKRLKWLLQILKERARQLEICGFESFREAVVHESQGVPGLIALVVFAEQAG
jgi:hypothetical protein